jgi:hypothetical protein
MCMSGIVAHAGSQALVERKPILDRCYRLNKCDQQGRAECFGITDKGPWPDLKSSERWGSHVYMSLEGWVGVSQERSVSFCSLNPHLQACSPLWTQLGKLAHLFIFPALHLKPRVLTWGSWVSKGPLSLMDPPHHHIPISVWWQSILLTFLGGMGGGCWGSNLGPCACQKKHSATELHPQLCVTFRHCSNRTLKGAG